MKTRHFRHLIFTILLAVGISPLTAQNVTNVSFVQKGAKVIITYTLDKNADISVGISFDGGRRFSPLYQLSGDFGTNVNAGNRTIIWDALEECNSIVGDNICFRVTAKKIKEEKDITDKYKLKSPRESLFHRAGDFLTDFLNDSYLEDQEDYIFTIGANTFFGKRRGFGISLGGYISWFYAEWGFSYLTNSEAKEAPSRFTHSQRYGATICTELNLRITPSIGFDVGLGPGEDNRPASWSVATRFGFPLNEYLELGLTPEYRFSLGDGFSLDKGLTFNISFLATIF